MYWKKLPKAGIWSLYQLEYFMTYTVTYELLEYIKRFKGPVKLSKKTYLNEIFRHFVASSLSQNMLFARLILAEPKKTSKITHLTLSVGYDTKIKNMYFDPSCKTICKLFD